VLVALAKTFQDGHERASTTLRRTPSHFCSIILPYFSSDKRTEAGKLSRHRTSNPSERRQLGKSYSDQRNRKNSQMQMRGLRGSRCPSLPARTFATSRPSIFFPLASQRHGRRVRTDRTRERDFVLARRDYYFPSFPGKRFASLSARSIASA